MKIICLIAILVTGLNLQGQRSIKRVIEENVFTNTDGEKHTLTQIIEQHKGKVLYIDFWASWCGPCKKEMKFSRKLHEKIDHDKIEFIYISIDESIAAWEKSMKSLKITEQGKHYQRGQRGMIDFLKFFYIYSIPHYMIIDAKGNIHNRDALPPSDPKLEKQLIKLL